MLLCAAFVAFAFLLGSSGNVSAEETVVGNTHYVYGSIATNDTWKTGGTYIVNSTVTVNDGCTLTIQAGVTVLFNQSQSINVDGSLVIQGTQSQPVTFFVNDTATQWGGINVDYGSISVNYGNFANATNAISAYNSEVSVLNSEFSANTKAVYLSTCRDATVSGNTILDSRDDGIYVYAGNAGHLGNLTIENNIIDNSTEQGIDFYIYGTDFRNVTISHNTVGDSGSGIEIEFYYDVISNLTLLDNTLTGNENYGIYADYYASNIENLLISENKVYGTVRVQSGSYDGSGIYFTYGSNSNSRIGNLTTSYNEVKDNGRYGICLLTNRIVGDAIIDRNEAENNDYIGIYVDGESYGEVYIRDNTVSKNGVDGIYIYGNNFGNVTIARNQFIGNGYNGISFDGGDFGNVFIGGNTATNNGASGIYFEADDVLDVYIHNNTVESNGEYYDNGEGYGIYFEADDYGNVTVRDNCAIDNVCGIGISLDYGLGDVVIERNHAQDNEYGGIYLEGGSLSEVYIGGNKVQDSEGYGIYIYIQYGNSVNITVAGNNVTGNDGVGIYISGYHGEIEKIVVENNNVRDNGHGIEVYAGIDSDFNDVFIESNVVENNNENGIYVGGYGEYYGTEYYSSIANVVIGNNTVLDNLGFGIIVSEYDLYDYRWKGIDIDNVELYNGEISNNLNGGVYVLGPYEVHWYADSSAIVRSNSVLFQGDVVVNGTMLLNGVRSFMIYGSITVNEGGTLNAVNTNIGTGPTGLQFTRDDDSMSYYDYYEFKVYGKLTLSVVKVAGAVELYLGPTSTASIKDSSVFMNLKHGVVIDGASVNILDSNFANNGLAGIFITGDAVNPLIKGNLFIMNQHGILSNGASLGNVIGNIFYMNTLAGINVVDTPSGKIIGNTFLLNRVEIAVDSSTVSITNNKIGYSESFPAETVFDLINDMGYLTALLDELDDHGPESLLEGSWLYSGGSENIYDLLTNHVGIVLIDSEVTTSGNTYGMLITAISATNSKLHFGDDILFPGPKNATVTVPYYALNLEYLLSLMISDGYYSYATAAAAPAADESSSDLPWLIKYAKLPLAVRNGISATNSTVNIAGSTIQVLDLSVFLDNSDATVKDSDFSASSQGMLLINDSHASIEGSTEGSVQVEDTSSVTHVTGKEFAAEAWVLGLVAAVIVVGVIGAFLYNRKRQQK